MKKYSKKQEAIKNAKKQQQNQQITCNLWIFLSIIEIIRRIREDQKRMGRDPFYPDYKKREKR